MVYSQPTTRIDKSDWITPKQPVDLSSNFDGIANIQIHLDDLNMLTPLFADLIIDAVKGTSDKNAMFKAILTKIKESWDSTAPEDIKINKRRQRPILNTFNGEAITIYDVDVTKCEHSAIVYGYSSKPGRADVVVKDDTNVFIENSYIKDKQLNRKVRYKLINQIDTYIIPYDTMTYIFYPSAPDAINDAYETKTAREIEIEVHITNEIEKIYKYLEGILISKSLTDYATKFVENWKSIMEMDLRYNTTAINKRFEIWDKFRTRMVQFLENTPKDHQLKFFTEETLTAIRNALDSVKDV